MLNHIKVFLVVIFLSGCQPDDKSNQSEVGAPGAESLETLQTKKSESERLNEWFAVKYEEKLQMSPMSMTMLFGRKDKYDQIDDATEAGEDRQLVWLGKTVAKLKSEFNYDALEPEAKTSYDIWVYQYEQALEAQKYVRNTYVFTQMQGMQGMFAFFMINFHRVDDESDMLAYNKRLGGIAKAISDLLERAKLHASEGVRPPRFAYEAVIEEATNQISGNPFSDGKQDSPLWLDAKSKISALVKDGKITQDQADKLQLSTRQVLLNEFGPSYERLINWFKADMENTSEIAQGVGSLPRGESYYQHSLRARTTTALSSDEIHQLGLREVERITEEMMAVKSKVGFEGSLQEFFKFLKEDNQFYYPNTDEGRQGYIKDTEKFYDFIKDQLPKYFGILPKADLIVKRVEPFREQDGAAQHYFPATRDGSRPGVYYAHLSDMRAMPKYQMEGIAIHEGIPGHHMQISIAQEITNLPLFRTQARFTAYVEGWGLYAELLAREMGSYQDHYSDFGRLSNEMWRAVRLVVDTGLHSKGWTEDQAIEFFMKSTPVADESAKSEVRRYLVWPGQATAYKIGMLKILELRHYAEKSLGDKFDIRRFHDIILGGGEVPLTILERRVQEWVGSVAAAK